MKLNLETKTKEQELVKAYLENNASEILAEKINSGVRIEKDGKMLINKKTLDGFMKYASDEARKLASKGANSACVEDKVVYGWAIHYFEEDSIEETFYNEDDTEYKPAPKFTPAKVKNVEPEKPKQQQISLFEFMDSEKKKKLQIPKIQTSTMSPKNLQKKKFVSLTKIWTSIKAFSTKLKTKCKQ